jgi:hypothetical protein
MGAGFFNLLNQSHQGMGYPLWRLIPHAVKKTIAARAAMTGGTVSRFVEDLGVVS